MSTIILLINCLSVNGLKNAYKKLKKKLQLEDPFSLPITSLM